MIVSKVQRFFYRKIAFLLLVLFCHRQLWSSALRFGCARWRAPRPLYYYDSALISISHPTFTSIKSSSTSSSLLSSTQKHHDRRVTIDPISLFNADIERVASVPSPKSAQRAEQMLNHMQDLYKSGSRTIRPNKATYIIVINAYGEFIMWLRKNNPKGLTSSTVMNAVVRATTLHNELWELYVEHPKLNSLLKPDVATYNALLNVLAQASGCAGDMRYNSSRNLMNIAHDSNSQITPLLGQNIDTSKNCSFAELSELILMQMDRMSKTSTIISGHDEHGDLAPNIISYETVIKSWSISKHPDAPKRAAALLQYLEVQNSTITPTTHCYNMVIEAYAKSGLVSDFEKASSLLRRLEAAHLPAASKSEFCKPTVVSYAPLIYNLVRKVQQVIEKSSTDRSSSSEKMLLILKQLTDLLRSAVKVYREQNKSVHRNEDTDRLTFCFNIVINAWCSLPSGNTFAAKMAEDLLCKLEQLHEDGYGAKPDIVTYNSVMKVISRAPDGGSERCFRLLKRMDKLWIESCNISDVKPDIYTYSTCIDALVKSGEKGAAEKADQLLKQLEPRFLKGENVLNKYMFAAVMNAYIKSGHADTVGMVEKLLQRMKALYGTSRNDSLQPDVVCYTSLIIAYAHSKVAGSSEKVVSILEEIEMLHESGQQHMIPNVRTYTAAVQAISTSREKNIAKKAKAIIDRMAQRYNEGKLEEPPNIFTFNYMLNACANTSGADKEKMEAFSIAIQIFKKVLHDSRLKPNSFTYAFFLKACAKLLPPSVQRERIAFQTFQRCCRDGQVSDEVLFRTKQVCSRGVIKGLLWKDSNGEYVEKVPTAWSKNTK